MESGLSDMGMQTSRTFPVQAYGARFIRMLVAQSSEEDTNLQCRVSQCSITRLGGVFVFKSQKGETMNFAEYNGFLEAVPVWQADKADEMNHTLLFRSVVKNKTGIIKIACGCCYRLCVNGKFAASGPARAAHGFYRVDEICLDEYLTEEKNVITILTAGYNVNNFEYVEGVQFLCAEFVSGTECISATGVYNFDAVEYTQKLKYTQRYSFQRTFSEVYRYTSDYNKIETNADAEITPVELTEVFPGKFLDRSVPYPDYQIDLAKSILSAGDVGKSEKTEYYTDRSISNISPIFKGYTVDELEYFSSNEYGKLDFYEKASGNFEASGAKLKKDSYAVFDMGAELTGFIELKVRCSEKTTIIVGFDEILTDGRADPFRLKTCSVAVWELDAGTYDLFTLEPYSYRYINVIALGADAYIDSVSLRRYEFNRGEITAQKPEMNDPVLDKIYDAAVSTFCQNTLDIYMDCPSRERAGWLCDSFFTSRVEYALTGKTAVERNFIENFILPESFGFIPEGMLPMCYPSDHNDTKYIPNWAMWFVVELEEYLQRSSDRALVDACRDRVYALLGFLKTFENNEGLLSKLESWVFIEWSESNKLTQDISFPSNMLYCKFKRCIAKLYGDEKLSKEADELAETIRNYSFMGDFFCDNAVYDASGEPVLSGKCTESCQYYAFFTDIATPELYPELWDTLVNDFGPERKETRKWERIPFANAFIGNYLRLELLYRYGLYDKVTENIRGYFEMMADKTGTLWENDTTCASCNHGFASHVIYWLCGIYNK